MTFLNRIRGKYTRVEILVFSLVFVASCLLGFYQLETRALNFEELGTTHEVRFRYEFLFDYILKGKHPPLYFFLIKVITQNFGISEYTLRLPSVLSYIFFMQTFYLVLKSQFGIGIGFLTTLFMALSRPLIFFSQDARPYMFVVLFCFLSASWMSKTLAKTSEIRSELRISWYLIYTLLGILSLYTSYLSGLFFVLSAVGGNLWLIVKKLPFKRLLTFSSLVATLYLPWFLRTYTKISATSYEYPSGFIYWKEVFLKSFNGSLFLLVSVGGVFLYFLLNLFDRRKGEVKFSEIFSLLYLGTFTVCLIRSYFFSSILSYRYLIWLVPFIYFGFAGGLNKLFSKKASVVVLISLLVPMYLGGPWRLNLKDPVVDLYAEWLYVKDYEKALRQAAKIKYSLDELGEDKAKIFLYMWNPRFLRFYTDRIAGMESVFSELPYRYGERVNCISHSLEQNRDYIIKYLPKYFVTVRDETFCEVFDSYFEGIAIKKESHNITGLIVDTWEKI